MMKLISSAENSKVKAFRKLYRRKNREKEGLFIIEGPVLIADAVKSGLKIKTLFLRSGSSDTLNLKNNEGRWFGDEVYELPDVLFDNMVETDTPQAAAAVVYMPDIGREDFYNAAGSIVVLDRIQDPGNLGTILRTAEAAGFDGIIAMKGTADLFSPKTVRAAAGSISRINIKYEDSPQKVLQELKKHGRFSICTSPHAEKNYFEASLEGKIAIIIGNEANGVCDEFMNGADMNVTLPMKGGNESLNVAVSAAIVMYESLRRNM